MRQKPMVIMKFPEQGWLFLHFDYLNQQKALTDMHTLKITGFGVIEFIGYWWIAEKNADQ